MKLYNFNRFSGGDRLVKGFIYTFPVAVIASFLLGLLQNFLRMQLSLSYLLIAYIIAWTFKKYGRSVSNYARYICVGIFLFAIILIDVYTFFGTNIPSIITILSFAPTILINKVNIGSTAAMINLVIIFYALYYVYTNSRIV